MTFAAACRHITNFTSAHESQVSLVGPARTTYPPSHIEIDNRLSWFLGRLEKEYGDEAYYVHLRRDPDATARSYTKRWWPGALGYTFATGIYLFLPKEVDRLAITRDLVATVNANVEQFLGNKTKVMTITLETATTTFPIFWQWIGAEGNLAAALAEWQTHYNLMPLPPLGGSTHRLARLWRRCGQGVRKIRRLIRELPGFIRSV